MKDFNLQEAREKAGFTQQQLAEKVKVSRKTINLYENSGEIPPDKLLLFELFFKNVTNSYPSDRDSVTKVSESRINYLTKSSEPPRVDKYQLIENYEEIPKQFRSWVKPFYPDLKVGAGFDISDFKTQTKFFLLVPFSERVEFWAQVEGSSMFPKYSSNDLVGLAEIFLDDVFPGNDYVIDLKHGKSHLKRIEFVKDSPEKFSLCSYNPEHNSKEMDIDKIRAFFKVKMHINYQ